MGAADVRGETLQDAVKSVLQNNPDITSVSYNRLGRDQEVRQAMADFFPTIDTSLSAGYINQNNPLDYREQIQATFSDYQAQSEFIPGGRYAVGNESPKIQSSFSGISYTGDIRKYRIARLQSLPELSTRT